MSVDLIKKIINKKDMKINILKFLISVCVVFLFTIFQPVMAEEDFQKIYDELEPANFEYIFGIDPYQAEEYKQYMFSPYPLMRTGVNFIFKETVIPPGFYLLTPRKKMAEPMFYLKKTAVLNIWCLVIMLTLQLKNFMMNIFQNQNHQMAKV